MVSYTNNINDQWVRTKILPNADIDKEMLIRIKNLHHCQ
jgi:hypothetical protein